jgi:hypothetical protein
VDILLLAIIEFTRGQLVISFLILKILHHLMSAVPALSAVAEGVRPYSAVLSTGRQTNFSNCSEKYGTGGDSYS